MTNKLKTILTGLGLLLLAACSDNKAYETSYCALADISGTYASEKGSIVKIIKAGILPEMVPGDSIFFIMIDSNSYQDDNIVTKMTLDYRPTEVNNQKLSFSKQLDKFANGNDRSKHTDISGAMMLCSENLKKTGSGTQIMFVFSDMKEELPEGVVRNFRDDEFKGIDIAAMNVIKLNKDSANPEIYRKRMDEWEKKVKKYGAEDWNSQLDATKVREFIENAK